jgi:hypothetical protein
VNCFEWYIAYFMQNNDQHHQGNFPQMKGGVGFQHSKTCRNRRLTPSAMRDINSTLLFMFPGILIDVDISVFIAQGTRQKS